MSLYKNEEQIEFADLVEISGLKPAEIARRIQISRPSVSRILKGEQTPRPSTLELLRRVVKQAATPGAHEEKSGPPKYPRHPSNSTQPGNDEFGDTVNKLSEIRDQDEPAFHTIREVINTYHRNLKPSKKRA